MVQQHAHKNAGEGFHKPPKASIPAGRRRAVATRHLLTEQAGVGVELGLYWRSLYLFNLG